VTKNVMEKIRKLMRLGKDAGATENERMVALEMAQRLMLQHNIEDVEEERVIEAIKGEWMNVDRGDLWEIYAAGAVAKLFNCRSLIIKRTGAHQFVGKPDNVEACGETFVWVCSQIEVLYKEALRDYSGTLDKRGRADLRKSFKYACSLRVHQRCEEIVAKARNDIPAHMALVVIDQSLAAADELIKGAKPMKARGQRAGIGTMAGRLAGDRVRLQGTITGSNGD
jgi:Protein of unknown function (DUF2786)